ncbi:MAG: arylsulfatase [Hyphomonadaceae bacterium]|nr:arylsulfatase [Hyphomonadaceae bacterium]
MSLRQVIACITFAATALCAGASWAQPAAPARPNIVVFLVDDAGFSDFSAYGGEARMPAIDRLAQGGVRFSNFHTSPLCAPSRAMLLTGMDSHRTGVSTIPEVLPPEQRNRPGYSLRLEPGVETVAARLRAAGYRTYMTGKWHLGHGPGDLPDAHGFDRSFALDASGADNWAQKSYLPYYATADWFEDGAPASLPDDFYSSQFLIDRMIDYLDADAAAQTPFFAYVAFQAVHIPVQAPRAFIELHRGLYDQGWRALQARRFAQARALGLVSETAQMPAFPATARNWDALSPEQRLIETRSMEAHAGMLSAMDHHIGRLIAYLERTGAGANTLFIITSDNGPEPSAPMSVDGFAQWMAANGYRREAADMGERGSLAYIGREWALATATPGAFYKFTASEGGLRVPLIIAGPQVAAGGIAPGFSFVTDIAPTMLDYAGVALDEAARAAIDGRTLRPALGDPTAPIYPDDAPIGVEVSGNAALFRGRHKAVRNLPPLGDGRWRLYDIAADPGETRDLSAAEPALLAALIADYDAYAARVGVLEMPAGYDIQRQVSRNALAAQARRLAWIPALAAAILAALVGAWVVLRRRKAAKT